MKWTKNIFICQFTHVGGLINQKTALSSTNHWAEALKRFCITVGGVAAAVSAFVQLNQFSQILSRQCCLYKTHLDSHQTLLLQPLQGFFRSICWDSWGEFSDGLGCCINIHPIWPVKAHAWKQEILRFLDSQVLMRVIACWGDSYCQTLLSFSQNRRWCFWQNMLSDNILVT